MSEVALKMSSDKNEENYLRGRGEGNVTFSTQKKTLSQR